MLKDPALEARARDLSQELRCMVCQNQSIDNSDAPLAHDLRVLVRQRLEAGDSDQQVIDFIWSRATASSCCSSRALSSHTLLLWGLPPAALLAGIIALFFTIRRRPAAEAPALSSEEQRKLASLVEGGRD